MVIRSATIADIPALEKLIEASVRVLGQGYYTDEQIEASLAEIFGVDTQLISDGTYFVAEADGQIVGCGGWGKRQTLFGSDVHKSGSVDALLDPAKDAARIRAFYVHPNSARRGIGKQLLKSCEDAARSAGFNRVELIATLPGKPMYAAMGYTIIKATTLPMTNGTLPAYRMSKVLSQDL